AKLLEGCGHLHVSGPSLFSARIIELTTKAVELVKSNGGTISFDPNIRKEVVGDPEVGGALAAMLARCDTFLPSGDELTLLTEATTPEAAIAELLALGVTAIVVKNGAEERPTTTSTAGLARRAIRYRRWTPPAPATASTPPSSP